jgi:subtilisin family serine protease
MLAFMELKMGSCRRSSRLCLILVAVLMLFLVLMPMGSFFVPASLRGIHVVSAEEVQTVFWDNINWAVRQINATMSVWSESTGSSVKVAVLDTGVSSIDDVKVYGGYNFVDDNMDVTDRYGHGTMIASMIAATHSNSSSGLLGVAPDVEIYAVKILDDKGGITLEHAIAGVQWAIDNDMQIISMSWCINDKNNALKQILDVAYSKGILLVAAAGNTGDVAFGVGCPANYESTIAVSAIKEDTRKFEQACTGPEIELTGPGDDVWGIGPDNRVCRNTGTSFAVAYVTGTAALVWAKNTTLTNTQVRNILCQTATDMQLNDGLDRDIFFGYGLVNATAAIQAATPNSNQQQPQTPPTEQPQTQNPPTTQTQSTKQQQPQQQTPPPPVETITDPDKKTSTNSNNNDFTNPPDTNIIPNTNNHITNAIIGIVGISITIGIIFSINTLHQKQKRP